VPVDTALSLPHLLAVLPELVLLVVAGIVLAADVALPETRRRELGLIAATGVFVALLLALALAQPPAGGAVVLGGMLRHDQFAFVFRVLFLVAALLACLLSVDSPLVGKLGQYYVVLLIATIGMNLMAASNDLVMLFVAIETSSISQYMLAGFLRGSARSAEAGLKYFLFGSAASAVMVYGMSFLYGLTRATGFEEIAAGLTAGGAAISVPALAAVVLVLVGLGFKISAVPFHFWAPDVYEGAPTPVTAFISVASKAAGFSVLLRLFVSVFQQPAVADKTWAMMLAITAVTMTLGNLLALQQRNIKRMLAYSSIAQAGYVLIGFLAFNPADPSGTLSGLAASTYYLMMYVLTNLAAFAVVILFANLTGSDEIKDYAGLSRRSPYLALVMLIALLSLGGMPPLAGFVAKFLLFAAALVPGVAGPERYNQMIALVLLGVLNAIVGLYYYLIVAKVMYVDRAPGDSVPVPVPGAYRVVLAICVLGILALGIYATPWLNWSTQAVAALTGATGLAGR
jgi:NADH-quinone oxidoreductase subunit N